MVYIMKEMCMTDSTYVGYICVKCVVWWNYSTGYFIFTLYNERS